MHFIFKIYIIYIEYKLYVHISIQTRKKNTKPCVVYELKSRDTENFFLFNNRTLCIIIIIIYNLNLIIF